MTQNLNPKNNIKLFFPTPILFMEDEKYAAEMLPVAKKFLSRKDLLTNYWGYKNTYHAGLERFKELEQFKKYICKIGSDFLSSLGYDYSNKKLNAQIFASEMVRGDAHGRHTHPNGLLSGVFYLQVPKNASRIIFYDPRPFRNFVQHQQKKEKKTIFTEQKIYIPPKQGLLLLCESWMEHEVEESITDESRITLVFNLY